MPRKSKAETIADYPEINRWGGPVIKWRKCTYIWSAGIIKNLLIPWNLGVE